jgi:hypothetical protein
MEVVTGHFGIYPYGIEPSNEIKSLYLNNIMLYILLFLFAYGSCIELPCSSNSSLGILPGICVCNQNSCPLLPRILPLKTGSYSSYTTSFSGYRFKEYNADINFASLNNRCLSDAELSLNLEWAGFLIIYSRPNNYWLRGVIFRRFCY